MIKSKTLFYSKLDFDDINNKEVIEKGNLLYNIFLTHFYYLSFNSNGDFNINFKEMDNLLKSINSDTYYLDYDIINKKITKNFISKNKNIFVKKGGYTFDKDSFSKLYSKLSINFVNYDNHKNIESVWKPTHITINDMTFAIILNYLSISPPVILQNQDILDEINILYNRFMKSSKSVRRVDYVKENNIIKKRLNTLTNNMINKKYTIKEQVLYNARFNNKLDYNKIEKVLFLYNKISKIKPYIFIIDNKLFLTMRGTQTYEQVLQDIYSIQQKKISDIIDTYSKKNIVSPKYKKTLDIVKKSYGEYNYAYGFFEPVLYVFENILNYIVNNRKYYDDIYIMGHSLGAAEATIIALFLLCLRKKYKFNFIKLITFGEPSALKDSELTKKFIKQVHKEKKFDYVRCVAYFKEGDKVYKDPIVVSNPINTIFFDKYT
jgi:hypothetical protein